MAEIEPYEAGYMKPPKQHRFKLGRSGNPKGRPKRIETPYAALQRVLGRRITLKGQDKKITIREALIRRLRDQALAGDRRAIALSQKILALAATPSHRDANTDLDSAKATLAQMLGLEVVEASEADDGE
jgi:hypothetical protein